MCAINGFTFHNPSLLKKMMHICKKRGPDWDDAYYDNNISLGHINFWIKDQKNIDKVKFFFLKSIIDLI